MSAGASSQNSNYPPGTLLAGKYSLGRLIGSGGMGVLYEAMHVDLEQRVAIKLLRSSLVTDDEAIARFAREARAAARVKSDHVVRVLDVARLDDGTPYIVMEHLEGEDLEHILERSGPLPVAAVADYAIQVCDALAEAHAANVVHRDLKPANIFRVSRPQKDAGTIKVLDFGISKLMSGDGARRATTTTSLMGTPCYMSPEQLRAGEEPDPRSDLWALGVTMFELLTGELAFSAPTVPQLCTKILEANPPRVTDVDPRLPPELGEIVDRCLRKDPDARFKDAGELALALAPFATGAHAAAAQLALVVGAHAIPTPMLPPPTAPRAFRPVGPLASSAQTLVAPDTGPVILLERRRDRSAAWRAGIVGGALAVAAVIAFALVAMRGASSAPVSPAASSAPVAAPASATPPPSATAAAAASVAPTPSAAPSASAPASPTARGRAPKPPAAPHGPFVRPPPPSDEYGGRR